MSLEHNERPHDALGAFMVGPGLVARGRGAGALSGTRFAVKDLFDVAATRTGAGNPAWLSEARVATTHSPAVQALLDAGADLWGKTVTDELAFSLSGTNVHYGTPQNPRAPGRVPGGSSSGSASAVAGGAVELALGTDTGGSVRVPASYCGIFGLRPTHGRVPISGVVGLAPSFDTVGVLAGSGRLLALATSALLAVTLPKAASKPQRLERLVLAADLFSLADAGARAALAKAARDLAHALGVPLCEGTLGAPGDIERWRDAFRSIQLAEVWQLHGHWVSTRDRGFGPGVASRFAAAAAQSPRLAEHARAARSQALVALERLLGPGSLMVQPAAAGAAPLIGLGGAAKDEMRARTLALTSPAGLAGAPAVSVPIASLPSPDEGEGNGEAVAPGRSLPVGLALVGLPGDDETLTDVAEIADRSGLTATTTPALGLSRG